MALQGNIETFALPDVLRLLASTKKTGVLQLDGARGIGQLMVFEGQLVGGEASQAPHAEGSLDVLFELLRFKDGDFIFEADAELENTQPPVEVEATLGAAEAQLEEWKGIEAVVPSLDHWVALAAALPGAEVTISTDRWAILVAIAGGCSVGHLGDTLSQGELNVSRNVKELLELGLVSLGEPREEIAVPAASVSAAPVSAVAVDDDAAAPFAASGGFVVGSDAEDDDEDGNAGRFDPDALVVDDGQSGFGDGFGGDSAPKTPAAATAVDDRPLDQADATEIARQLANLSPKAAKAVAAAAKATTIEEREALLAQVDDEDDPINRDLLIKFLGSVNG